MSRTNLKEVKQISKRLCDAVAISQGIAVSHPFATSTTGYISTDGSLVPVNLTDSNDYELWKAQLFGLIDECEDALSVYVLVNKPYLLTWLKYCKPYLSSRTFGILLRDAWTRCENANNDNNVSREELISWFSECTKHDIMNEEDLALYRTFPESVTIYRGVSHGRDPLGLSWTLNKRIAERFRDRYMHIQASNDGQLVYATVPKSRILAYFNDRDEEEVVVDTFELPYEIETC